MTSFLQSNTNDKVLLESPHHDQRLRTIFAIHERHMAEQSMDEKQRTVRDYFIASSVSTNSIVSSTRHFMVIFVANVNCG